ncbi:FecR family protein [Pedobacter sp. GR22-6]|uniref:FecR family protein n=1 Tax=Pedobacter sp. GR22-6 TaxID=3127957 RepID=UPI00307DD204
MTPAQRTAFLELVEKYLNGLADAEEVIVLEKYYQLFSEAPDALEQLNIEEVAAMETSLNEKIKIKIGQEQTGANTTRKVIPLYRRWQMIAAAVATIVFGVWFFTGDREVLKQVQDDVAVNDVAPGKSGATITLANGEVIQLSEAKKGVIIDPTSLTYDDGSEIASEAAQPRNDERGGGRGPDLRQDDGRVSSNVQMLTAATTKGQTYEFTLSDGSHVFLNADSKIIFPQQFSGKERKILLEGEAYFVVKHNEKQPFRVESKAADGRSQVVEDIGTEFNINAYADELSIKTTLVEGSAGVYTGTSLRTGVLINPNQQASLYNGKLSVKTVDPEQAIAWREGYFVFDRTRLDAVMRQISRWYNIKVEYADPDARLRMLGGSALRSGNLSVILKTLESTGVVKFEIADKKIIVK